MFAVGLVISYLFAAFGIVRTNLIPGKYLLPALLVPAIAAIGLAFLHAAKPLSRIKAIGIAVISLFVIIGNLYLYSLGSATARFLDAVQTDGYTYEEYSIIAKKDRHVKLSDNGHQAGFISTDANNDQVKKEVDARTKTIYQSYGELTSLTMALSDQHTDLAVIKSAYVQLLRENNPAFYQTTEILETFTVRQKNQTVPMQTDTTKPFVMYISGIDTYGAIGTVARSDVNILAIVNPRTHKILLVNTPRDYYVQLHGTTGPRDKLTHAGMYGIDMSVQTLEDLYGVDINYYMRVNFATLTSVVNTLGGVSVYSEYDFTAEGYHFNVGYNQLDGKAALSFSRARKQFEDGDRTRGHNQQRVIEAIIRKLSTPETLVNYQKIMAALSGTFQTNASSETIAAVMNKQLDDMEAWQIESASVTGTGRTDYTYSMGQIPLYVMEPDQPSIDTVKRKISHYLTAN
ncbi:LCP family protein [Streptomyces caniscabiei]|uniref:LCP family protein n=1 Tax=Streptomyces caniscabiei TaxID=2746961 RepID=UPI0029B1C136|nr:LCP family protein [Streptomyces caniscabiei]MDX2776118.1 LCP family protein [Streptomyces caniscabiei]